MYVCMHVCVCVCVCVCACVSGDCEGAQSVVDKNCRAVRQLEETAKETQTTLKQAHQSLEAGRLYTHTKREMHSH